MSKDRIQTEYETYLAMYEEKLKNDDSTIDSIKNRKSSIRKFFNYLCDFNSKPAFEDIKKVNIMNFLMVCEENGVMANTLNTSFSYLKDFFGFCKHKGFNKNSIFDGWNYRANNDIKRVFLTDEQIIDLKRIIDSYELSEISFRTEICFLILTYTGCTKEELCSLNIYKNSEIMKRNSEDVFNYILLDEKEIYFGKKRKMNIKSRMIPLNDYVIGKLIEYRNYLTNIHGIDFEHYPYLFPSHYDQNDSNFKKMNSSQINTGLKELINSSDLIKVKGSLFQMFRNTFVKNMIRDGVPINIIKELSGLDTTSLKDYVENIEHENIDEYERNLKERILGKSHPYKVLYN